MAQAVKQNKKIWFALFAILIAILAYLFIGFGVSDIVAFSQESPHLVALILLLLYCLTTVVWVIPKAVLYISAAIVFPLGLALIITYLGLFCSLLIGCLAGKLLGREKVIPLIEKNKTAKRILLGQNGLKPSLALMFRVLPLPIGLVNLFFGASGVRFLPYVLYSLAGLTPVIVAMKFIGSFVAVV